ncbi:prolyl oligopeptidase family serine peptidase [Haliangium sp.]|uniref:prolyl oligopeptidase family serine peptidase n=1 Tax=Haliangium sp. TaxID=2663208 RepID=UPI003D0FCD23
MRLLRFAWIASLGLSATALGGLGCKSKTGTLVPPSTPVQGPLLQGRDDPRREEVELVYPETPRDDVTDELHGTVVADPYRWLEDAGDARVQAWMEAQDQLARRYLGALPERNRLAARLRELSYYDAVSAPRKRGERYFYTRRHADKEKAVLYWKNGADGEERVLIDPNTLSEDGSISLGSWSPSEDGAKLAYNLSENAADEATLYVMDVDSGKTSQTDVIAGAKYAWASWTPDGKGFYYTRLPVDPDIPVAELPGHAHVRYHRLGTDPGADPIVYPATGNPRTFVGAAVSRDGRWLILSVQHGWNATDVYFKDLSERRRSRRGDHHGFTPLVTGVPATFQVWPWDDTFYVLTNHEADRYRVLAVDPDRPSMRRWKEIVPQSQAVIESFAVVGGHLVLTYLDNAHSRLEVRALDGTPVRQVELPGVGSVSNMIGNEDEDEAYYVFTSYTEPPQIYRTSVTSGDSELWSAIELPFDASRFAVDQVWYPSHDGTQISMFLIRPADAEPDGGNPTILYGYGGFNVTLTPAFSVNIAAWVERGGIYAIPNLRGGGEYGEAWHEAGMLLAKQNVFDDFLAAAEYLEHAGWTRPERLAISGGSNGGLLVGAAMTQAPARFAAVVCSVPLLDMVRYHLFGSGKTWIPEYGSAEDPAQFAALYAYSPYHRVAEGTSYPALLMLSADSDDRVDPMHARKFTAAVQWANVGDAPMLLRIERNAGHGGADLVRQQVERSADTLAFLHQLLGSAGGGTR